MSISTPALFQKHLPPELDYFCRSKRVVLGHPFTVAKADGSSATLLITAEQGMELSTTVQRDVLTFKVTISTQDPLKRLSHYFRRKKWERCASPEISFIIRKGSDRVFDALTAAATRTILACMDPKKATEFNVVNFTALVGASRRTLDATITGEHIIDIDIETQESFFKRFYKSLPSIITGLGMAVE